MQRPGEGQHNAMGEGTRWQLNEAALFPDRLAGDAAGLRGVA